MLTATGNCPTWGRFGQRKLTHPEEPQSGTMEVHSTTMGSENEDARGG